jgi:small subunit ribosomal protein S25e
MGGVKKKPLGSAEKGAAATGPAGGDIKPTKKDEAKKSSGSKPQQRQKLSVLVEEQQGMKSLQGMKAITVQGFARSAGVKISAANAFLRSLEGRGIVRNVGGYSGHRVYELLRR